MSFIKADFDITRISSPDFIFNTLTVTFANILVISASIMQENDRLERTDLDVLEKQKAIKDFVYDVMKPDFDDFLVEYNIEEKRFVWVENITEKINRLNPSADDIYIWKYGTEPQKKKNRYVQKRLMLEFQISDEFLKERLPYLKVKFDPVTRQLITSNLRKKGNRRGFITKHKFWKKIKDLSPKFMQSLALILVTNSFMLGYKDFTMVILFDVASKLIALFMNWFAGLDYSRHYLTEVVIADLQFRLDVIKNYLSWSKKRTSQWVLFLLLDNVNTIV